MSFRSLVKKFIPSGVFKKIEPWGHLGEAVIFNILYGFPARRLNIIGVTGTNGKTTTSFVIHRMMHEAGFSVGLMTTVGYGAGDNIKPQAAHMTTIPVPQLMKQIRWLKSQGIKWLVLETTSHALAQHRVWGIPYSVAVMTNVTHEHLDYHETFENYREAKRMLFKMCSRNRRGLRVGVINADDASAKLFEADIASSLTYGIKSGELKATDIKPMPDGSTFTVQSGTQADLQLNIKTNLVGRFNVYNTLAAVGVGMALGMEAAQIEKGIAALASVPGRMEKIEAGQNFEVIVDFAVTADALLNTLEAVKESTDGQVILVFGATGDRDKSKRPDMGRVAAEKADLIFLTDDETYSEDPAAIRRAVYEGIKAAGGAGKTTEVEDRRAAIRAAFKAAKEGDVVLLTGLGHQDYRVMNEGNVPWNEAEIAREILLKIK